MRLEKFEPNKSPIRKPEESSISMERAKDLLIVVETRPETLKDTPRQLKGRYYLTKIMHALMPDNIPDIHQAREDKDGKKTIDREAVIQTGSTVEANELKEGAKALRGELRNLGLRFETEEYYKINEGSHVNYLETFKPWQQDDEDPKKLEFFFKEEKIRKAIEELSDEKEKEICLGYFDRLLALAEEETAELAKGVIEKYEATPQIAILEEMYSAFEKEYPLEALHAITTKAEALTSPLRIGAKLALSHIYNRQELVFAQTDISAEKLGELFNRFRILSKAVGAMVGETIDHTR